MRSRRRWWLAAAAALTTGLLAGCGGSSGDAGTAGADRAVRFSQCVREHGVPDFPDPVDGRITMRGGGDPAVLQAAQAACRRFAPQGRATPQMQEQIIAFSQCMREHGEPDFPDPQGPGRLLVPRTIDTQSPQFEQARVACQGKLRGSGWGEGAGVGG
ncbi:MAG TPA: hypothetical protein VFV85_08220 [Conexibacter sp.]|nr:hypothetical protein [Conexibacter sp.]